MTPTQWQSWRRQKDIEAQQEIIVMTGRKTSLPNARMKDGKLEIDPPRKKKTVAQRYAEKNKRKWKPAR